MAVRMSPPRTFAGRAPPTLGPLPDLDDLEVLELSGACSDEDDADAEGVVVFNIGTPRGGSAIGKGTASPVAAHFAIGTPGNSPCLSGQTSLAGSCCPTPVGSDCSCTSPQHREIKVWGIERGNPRSCPLPAERGRSRAVGSAFGKAPFAKGRRQALSSGSTRSRSCSSSDSSRDPSPARAPLARGTVPLPEELLQAVMRKYNRSSCRDNLDDDFEIDSVSSDDDL